MRYILELNRTTAAVSGFFPIKASIPLTFAEMLPIGHNTYVVDTPGIREFGLVDIDAPGLSQFLSGNEEGFTYSLPIL